MRFTLDGDQRSRVVVVQEIVFRFGFVDLRRKTTSEPQPPSYARCDFKSCAVNSEPSTLCSCKRVFDALLAILMWAKRVPKATPVPAAEGAVKPSRRTRFEMELENLRERLEAEGKLVHTPRSILDEIEESRSERERIESR